MSRLKKGEREAFNSAKGWARYKHYEMSTVVMQLAEDASLNDIEIGAYVAGYMAGVRAEQVRAAEKAKEQQ